MPRGNPVNKKLWVAAPDTNLLDSHATLGMTTRGITIIKCGLVAPYPPTNTNH